MILCWDAVKDPDEIKDYRIDWKDVLEGDKIISSSWTVSSGENLTILSSPFSGTDAVVWLSGGDVGTYNLLNRIQTMGGRTYDQTVKLKVKSK